MTAKSYSNTVFLQLDHMFKRRLNASYKYAVEYVKQFPSPIVSMVAKLVAFISGAFAAVLILVALFDETLLQAHVCSQHPTLVLLFQCSMLRLAWERDTLNENVFVLVNISKSCNSST